jgi:hypothetical protein
MAKNKQMSTEKQTTERKWCWIGHSKDKPQGARERHALDCNPQGKRMRSRQRKPVYISAKAHKFVYKLFLYSIFIACHCFWKLISYYTRHNC